MHPALPQGRLTLSKEVLPMTHRKQFLRFLSVKELIGLSRSTIDRLEREGKFPKRRQISSNAVAWVFGEIEDWIEARANDNTG